MYSDTVIIIYVLHINIIKYEMRYNFVMKNLNCKNNEEKGADECIGNERGSKSNRLFLHFSLFFFLEENEFFQLYYIQVQVFFS